MKTDSRFVKVMLVLIASLLFLNCFKDGETSVFNGILGPKVEASAPSFLQDGKSYSCGGVGSGYSYTIIGREKDSAWIRAKFKSSGMGGDGEAWVNTAALDHCVENK